MNRGMLDGCMEKVGGDNICAFYVSDFANRGKTLFCQDCAGTVHRNAENHFGISPLKAEDNALCLASPAWFAASVLKVGVTNNIIGAILDVYNGWDLEIAVGVDGN